MNTTLYTSASRLVETHKDWSQHQERIMHVDWITDWTYDDFIAWFRECLNEKINREDKRTWRKLTADYQHGQAMDARSIRDYLNNRIRHTGCNGLLRTKELQARYPQINCQREGIE